MAGFTDAQASFQIKVFNRNNVDIRLNYVIDQKKIDILLLIKDFLGGNISYRKNKKYTYQSTSFGSAKNTIKYFDCFHILSNKTLDYFK